jgi:hypothetical protein
VVLAHSVIQAASADGLETPHALSNEQDPMSE